MASLNYHYFQSKIVSIPATISSLHLLYFLFFVCCVYGLYYITCVIHKPKLHCSEKGSFRKNLQEHIVELQKDLWPFVWCYRPLLQTIISSVFGPTVQAEFVRDVVNMNDGSFTIDWYDCGQNEDINENTKNKNAPIVIILPGHTGHSEKNYIRQFIALNMEMGYRTVVFNNRGLGENVLLTSAVLPCVTRSNDIEKTFTVVSDHYPGAPVMVVAFSIGACVFTNYLARKGTSIHPCIRAGYIVSVPWSSFESKAQLSKFWNRLVINDHMNGQILGIVKKNYHLFIKDKNLPIDILKVMKCKTVWDFDEFYTAPMFGYQNHIEYYADASLDSLPLKDIAVPVLCINADDDPMCRREALPLKKILENPNMAVITTKYGGHLAWLEGLFISTKRVHHRVFQQYSAMVFNNKNDVKQ